MRKIKKGFFLGLALFTCPCHLPLLIPLLAGTALGTFFAHNLVITAVGLGLIFATSLFLGLRGLKKESVI